MYLNLKKNLALLENKIKSMVIMWSCHNWADGRARKGQIPVQLRFIIKIHKVSEHYRVFAHLAKQQQTEINNPESTQQSTAKIRAINTAQNLLLSL